MKKSASHRRMAVAGIVLAASALLLASGTPPASVNARSGRPENPIAVADERRATHAELKTRLASTDLSEFKDSLGALSRLDENGALDVWRVALNNPDKSLSREAWRRYREVQSELSRKQFVPQIARIYAPADQILRIAKLSGLDVTIWTELGSQTVAAAPPYLIERLRNAGIGVSVMYDSVAEWQKSRANGDGAAQAITPEYQSASAGSLIRIAVIDLKERGTVAPGYSDWLGDRENILMRDDLRLAYMDVFPSDGSLSSINAHITDRYTQRGYKLLGFYTPEEFSDRAPQLFPGKTFEAGRRGKAAASGGLSIALDDGKYHSYDETIAEFKSLAAAHPELARYSKLGTSFEGREIFALKISKDPSVDDASKPDVLITGLHHAREWISVESPVYFANQLVSTYSTDDSVRYLVDHLQIWVVPIVNPDGLTYTQNSQNGQFDPVRLWRKNRRVISNATTCPTAVGVDLNRNYSYQWRLSEDAPCSESCSDRSCINDDIGGSDDPASEIYRGPQAESEAEVKAIKSLVDDPNRNFRAQLDYHNYTQLILYPWGYATFGTDDENTLSRLAQQMSDAVFGVDRKRYRAKQAVDLYSLTGSSIDYAYGVNRVPAPFVVEMRPECCDFSVPESQIQMVNQENWSGAQSLLHWAAGPPILESVKAYTPGPDGLFSKLVYSARWTTSNASGQRQMVVDARYPGIDPGRLQVRLQFSRPMNTSVAPLATLGRDARLDEVALSGVFGNGWEKTIYANDTWVGETVLIDDGNLTSSWRLAIFAIDPFGLKLDAAPNTIATYTAGMKHWANYEDSTGEGNDGGVDTRHSIGPGVRGDFPSILVASPEAGERLAGGDDYTITWTAPNAPGFAQSLSLSTDGGFSFAPLAEQIPSNAQRYRVTIPRVATARGRILLLATEPVSSNFMVAVSQADFSIGLNVGSNVDISFVSSEKVDLNWSDTTSDDPPTTASGASRLIVNVKITNRGSIPIVSPFLRVSEMNRYVLLTRDPKSKSAAGARFYVDAGSDNTLSPGEAVDARLVVGLLKQKKFFLAVEIYGVPDEPIVPANAVMVWTGKPKTR